jgi:hypothetical protein
LLQENNEQTIQDWLTLSTSKEFPSTEKFFLISRLVIEKSLTTLLNKWNKLNRLFFLNLFFILVLYACEIDTRRWWSTCLRKLLIWRECDLRGGIQYVNDWISRDTHGSIL